MMLNLFKRHAAAPAPQTSILPAEVAATIESAHVLARSSLSEGGEPRVLVTIPGRRFYGDAESIRAAVAERWPDLSPPQQRRAVAWLRSLVAARIRADHSQAGGESKQRWADWKPAHDAREL